MCAQTSRPKLWASANLADFSLLTSINIHRKQSAAPSAITVLVPEPCGLIQVITVIEGAITSGTVGRRVRCLLAFAEVK